MKLPSQSLRAFFLMSLLLVKTILAGSFEYPDFDQSMLRDLKCLNKRIEEVERVKKKYASYDQKMVAMFRDIYEQNIHAAQNDPVFTSKVRIPRIVHQIWLGGNVPEKYREWMESWLIGSGWEYKLWTDEDVKHFKLYNQDLYDKSDNYGEKADILRLEILNRFGGVYADTDYECLNPAVLEELHKNYDFYIGFEPLEHGCIYKYHLFKVCNAIMASAPGHPLIKDFIVNMKANFFAYIERTPVERTGPSYLTRIICQFELSRAHQYRNMYLPCSFIYPYTEMDLNYFIANPYISVDICPETLGIHYWSGSWKKVDPSMYSDATKFQNKD